MSRIAQTDNPVQDVIARRWSPYGFERKPIAQSDLLSIFEAARWAASSFNEQPWRFIVATQEESNAFGNVLSCLVDANQGWAKSASALALTVVSNSFARNGKPNGMAQHDVGLAVGNLSLEATSRGLVVHEMGGILPDKAREVFGIPEGFNALTGLAIGYAVSDPASLPDELRTRDEAPRARKPLNEIMFGTQWGG